MLMEYEICKDSGIQIGAMSSCNWNKLIPFTLIEGETAAAGIAQWFVSRLPCVEFLLR